MTTSRTSQRFRWLMLLAPMIALALGSFWLLDVMRRDINDSMPNTARSEPDYYVEKFTFTRMSKSKQSRHNVSGDRLTHHPLDDSYEILLPVVVSLKAGQPPMTVRAERAIADSNNSKLQLYDNVQMNRPASGNVQHFHFESEHLMILPDDDVMTTDKPVLLTFGSTRLTGIGMYANNATRQFQLKNNVRGNYHIALQP